MTPLLRVLVHVASAAMARPERARFREQVAADLDGARELGISPTSVAVGHLRTVPSAIDRGDVMPHPVGPLAIALRHAGTRRGPVVLLALALGAALLAGLAVLLL